MARDGATGLDERPPPCALIYAERTVVPAAVLRSSLPAGIARREIAVGYFARAIDFFLLRRSRGPRPGPTGTPTPRKYAADRNGCHLPVQTGRE
jgi:hypothetical protein